MQELLTTGMAALLSMATGLAAAEPWPQVHAFNALRLAFSESSLAIAASVYFAKGASRA